MLFLKLLLGGVLATIVAWFAVVAVHYWRTVSAARAQGVTGLIAVSGGWNYLVQLPTVLLLLTAAFGVGLYVTSRLLRQ